MADANDVLTELRELRGTVAVELSMLRAEARDTNTRLDVVIARLDHLVAVLQEAITLQARRLDALEQRVTRLETARN